VPTAPSLRGNVNGDCDEDAHVPAAAGAAIVVVVGAVVVVAVGAVVVVVGTVVVVAVGAVVVVVGAVVVGAVVVVVVVPDDGVHVHRPFFLHPGLPPLPDATYADGARTAAPMTAAANTIAKEMTTGRLVTCRTSAEASAE
jgi:hypothetical protein